VGAIVTEETNGSNAIRRSASSLSLPGRMPESIQRRNSSGATGLIDLNKLCGGRSTSSMTGAAAGSIGLKGKVCRLKSWKAIVSLYLN